MSLYLYRGIVVHVVDSDTLDCMIDLGFKMFHRVRVKLADVDPSKVNAIDPVEKVRGIRVRSKLNHALSCVDYKVFIDTSPTGKYDKWIASVHPRKDDSIIGESFNKMVCIWTGEVRNEGFI